MIQTEYRRELNHSYMIIRNSVPNLTQQYAYRMIRENRIKGLLACQERIVDGDSCLYYDISSRQTLGQFYEGKKLSAVMIVRILREIVQIQNELGEYMLDGQSLILDPSCIFLDVETEDASFCFYPGWGEEQSVYPALADFFLEYVDHSAENAVNLAYQFYKLSKASSFVLASFMPWAERECEETIKGEEETEVISLSEKGETDYWTAAAYMPEEELEQIPQRETDGSENKKSFLKELWNRIFTQKKGQEKGKSDFSGNARPEQTLWDLYADKLESRPAGETIYFSDLEKPVMEPSGVPWLVETEGKQKYCLENLPVTVGKLTQKAGIVLEDPSVSRVHARFFAETDDLWLIDMNSRNGTIVNEKKLAPNEAVKIHHGDRIQFGRERFELTFIDSKGE